MATLEADHPFEPVNKSWTARIKLIKLELFWDRDQNLQDVVRRRFIARPLEIEKEHLRLIKDRNIALVSMLNPAIR